MLIARAPGRNLGFLEGYRKYGHEIDMNDIRSCNFRSLGRIFMIIVSIRNEILSSPILNEEFGERQTKP